MTGQKAAFLGLVMLTGCVVANSTPPADGGVGGGGTAGAGAAGSSSAGVAGAGAAGSGSAGVGGHAAGGMAGAGSAGTGTGTAGTGGTGTAGTGGTGGMPATCMNACTSGATKCASGTTLQTCGAAMSGCTAFSTATTCSTGLVCERFAPAACADPNWAEWPMPNGPVDVAAGAPNSAQYMETETDTVTDTVTGLMWQKAVAPGTFTQAQAVAFCPTLTLAGHNDWRLPSLVELVSLVDYGQSLPNPTIDPTSFPSTPATRFWSSSPVAGSPSAAWAVYFFYGSVNTYVVSFMTNVRCVR
jgi:hypothetical protein